MKKSLIALVFLTSTAQATTYYVANDGDDNNNGLTTTTAWQSITKVNSAHFADNDTVLFKRGNIFRGSITTTNFPLGIQFDAYGMGENPVIAGSVKINNWKPSTLGANIYEANVSQFITADSQGVENKLENLFVNGKLMTIARYPNVVSPDKTNWLKVGTTAETDAFTDPKLAIYNKPVDYWKGATLRIRTYSWFYKVFPITGFSNGKIIATGLGTQLPKWGYFIDGKLSELDYPNEWYYDATTKKVYLYSAQNSNPNTLLVEGSTYKTGISIYWHEDNSVIKNLTFRHFINAGIEINSSNNITVQNCKFEYNMTGITTWNPSNLFISNNNFNQQLNTGILLNAATGFDVAHSIIEKNTMTNTGMFPLYCQRYSGVCYGIAISVFGKAFTIRENILENTGWTSVYLKAEGSHLVENNVIRGALSLLNDGGAIAVGSNDNIIRGNFLLNSIGNIDKSNGCANTSSLPCSQHVSYGMGVGADSNYKNILIEGNTIAGHNDWAIRFNSFTHSQIRNNLLFNNESQITLEDKSGISANNIVSGNTIYSAMPNQIGIKMTGTTEHGQLDTNFYCNPYSDVFFNRDNKYYSLAHWRNSFNQDQLSKNCNLEFLEYTTTVTGTEMFSNTDFNSDIKGWYGGIYEPSVTGMTGGSLKYNNRGRNGYVNYENLSLKAGQFYRMRFRLKGSTFGNVELQINDLTDRAAIQSRYFAYSETAKNYELVFKSSRTTTKGEVVFISRAYDAPFYGLDDVSLMPVTAKVAKKPGVLFMNSTAQVKKINLLTTYVDLEGTTMSSPLTLNPFSSRILIKK